MYHGLIFIDNMKGTVFVLYQNGTLFRRIYTGIGGGPENLLFMGNNILIYGLGNNITSEPIAKFLNDSANS